MVAKVLCAALLIEAAGLTPKTEFNGRERKRAIIRLLAVHLPNLFVVSEGMPCLHVRLPDRYHGLLVY